MRWAATIAITLIGAALWALLCIWVFGETNVATLLGIMGGFVIGTTTVAVVDP